MGIRLRRTKVRILTILILLGLVSVFGMNFASSEHGTHQVRYITVQAYRWGFSPSVIKADRWDTLVIKVESLDSVHGFSIDGYDITIKDIIPGDSVKTQLYAGTPGKFKIRCNTICGALHPFMTGELVVEQNIPSTYTLLLTVLLSIALIAIFLLGGRDNG